MPCLSRSSNTRCTHTLQPQLVDIVVALEPTFGGINLEDIRRCVCLCLCVGGGGGGLTLGWVGPSLGAAGAHTTVTCVMRLAQPSGRGVCPHTLLITHGAPGLHRVNPVRTYPRPLQHNTQPRVLLRGARVPAAHEHPRVPREGWAGSRGVVVGL